MHKMITRRRKISSASRNETHVCPKNKRTQSVSSENANDDRVPQRYAKLMGMRPGMRNIYLTQDVFVCGRDALLDYDFSDLAADSNIYTYISKKQFTIVWDRNMKEVRLYDFSRNGTLIGQNKIGKGNSQILKHGDLISIGLPDKLVFLFEEERAEKYPEVMLKNYTVSNVQLGKGGYGKVLLGYKKNQERSMVAIKILNTNTLASRCSRAFAKIGDIKNEVDIMRQLDHPNCVKVHDFFELPGTSFIVLEYIGGGEFFDKIVDPKFDRQGCGEELGKFYAYQLINALDYLHSKNITHRDIKPENILCLTKSDYTVLKISDYGMAKYHKTMKTNCGTPSYSAPEICTKDRISYTPKVDVWSLGCVLFIVFVGYPPFSEDYGDMPIAQQVSTARLLFHSQWRHISLETCDMIKWMITKNPVDRASAFQLLHSPWMKCPEAEKARRIVESYSKRKIFPL